MLQAQKTQNKMLSIHFTIYETDLLHNKKCVLILKTNVILVHCAWYLYRRNTIYVNIKQIRHLTSW